MSFSRIVVVVAGIVLGNGPAWAQDPGVFQGGVQVVAAAVSELDATDVGLSGRLTWFVVPSVGVEAELTTFPSQLPDMAPVTSDRLEGLFGVTVGPWLGPLRAFARIRPGFVRFSEAPAPVACIRIFPPPLRCLIAEGHTGVAFDLGGGVETRVTRRISLRIDVGDRMVRYPGPSLSVDRDRHDEPFYAHDLRFAAGASWTF
jgi:hypothetical protein